MTTAATDSLLVILGTGGHGRVCAALAKRTGRYETIAFSDPEAKLGSRILGYPVQFRDEELRSRGPGSTLLVIGIGMTTASGVRQRVFDQFLQEGFDFATLISPMAVVSQHADVGAGSVIGDLAVVNVFARVGSNCIINTAALVEHDAVVEDHTHVATGAVINGGCHVGAQTMIGSNATVNHGVSICSDCTIGAGAVVVADITEPGTYVGIPARALSSSSKEGGS